MLIEHSKDLNPHSKISAIAVEVEDTPHWIFRIEVPPA